jgi:hypothetical protein
MLCMCVYMHFRFVENHPIRILKDGPLISEGVLSQRMSRDLTAFIAAILQQLVRGATPTIFSMGATLGPYSTIMPEAIAVPCSSPAS